MGEGNNYERLERCNKKELIEKIIVRDKHCNDLKDLLAKGLEKYKLLEKENEEIKEKLELTENDRDEREMKAKELKKELDKLRTDNIYEEGLYS